MPFRLTFFVVLFLSFFLTKKLLAQGSQELLPKGARAAALGHASLTLIDGWALFNNPGALGLITEATAVVGYDHRWQLAELSSLGAAYAHPLANGSMTVGASRFGGPHMHESKLKLAYAHRVGPAAIGVKVTYSTLYMAGIGSAGAFYIDAGLHMALSKKLYMGMHAVNLNAARWSSETEERYPSLIKIGLGYHLSEKLQVFAQGEKDLFYPFGIQTGLAYQLVDALQLRLGVNQLQESLHGGFGFRYGKLDISFASRHHQALGFTHHAAFRLDF